MAAPNARILTILDFMKLTLKSILKPFAIVISLALLAAGCGGGGSASAPAQLVVWKVFEDTAHFQPLLQEFQKKYPNVRVTFVQKDVVGYEEELLNALASGKGPDIFSINNAWLPKYIDKLSPVSEKQWTFNDYKNTFVDVAVDDFTRDRRVYGAATYVDSLALYYNKDILGTNGIATPPRTWDELARDVQNITRQNQTGYFTRSGLAAGVSSQAPGGQVNRAEDIVYLFMLQKGAQAWSADGTRPVFNNSVVDASGRETHPAREALDFYTSFASPTSPNYSWNTRSDYSIDAFANSRAAFMINYSHARELVIQKASNLNFDIAQVPQPSLDNSEVNFANYWGEVVSRQSKYQTEAWNFLKTVTGKDVLDKYYAGRKLPSSRKDLIELQTSDPDIGVFAHENLTAKAFYRPDQPKFDAIMAKAIDGVVLQGMSVSEALSQAASQGSALAVPRSN